MRIGVDLGGTKIELILIDACGTEQFRKRIDTPRPREYQGILKAVAGLVQDIDHQSGKRYPVGIGTPGSLSTTTGLLRNSNTVCLNGRPLLQDLKAILGSRVAMANDANCFALSEAVDGAGQGNEVVFGVIMGTGVGGGVVVNGRVLSGHNGIGGEWGHNPLRENGPQCYCVRHGCVETLLSGPGLLANYETTAPDRYASARCLIEAAEAGDSFAASITDRFVENFGRAMASVINILDPDIIVLGGGLSNYQRLYSEGKACIAPHVFSDHFDTPVVSNVHGDSSGVRGAAWLTDR